MTRLLACTAVALAMGLTPVLAADTSTQPEASQSATTPSSGSADTSGAATDQSSMGKMGEQNSNVPSAASSSAKMTPGGTPAPNPTAPSSGD